MFTDSYFQTDKDRKRKKIFSRNVRASIAPSDIARAHVREDFFFAFTVHPPIACLFCNCPAIWSSIYEPDIFKCCDCDPPPGGWHYLAGGWAFVGRRLILVRDPHYLTGADVWHWESLPRTDWRQKLSATYFRFLSGA